MVLIPIPITILIPIRTLLPTFNFGPSESTDRLTLSFALTLARLHINRNVLALVGSTGILAPDLHVSDTRVGGSD